MSSHKLVTKKKFSFKYLLKSAITSSRKSSRVFQQEKFLEIMTVYRVGHIKMYSLKWLTKSREESNQA